MKYKKGYVVDATSLDETFDKNIGSEGGHTCCGSRAKWRHKISCKYSYKNYKDDLSDLKDI
jgi:hypothetical protein